MTTRSEDLAALCDELERHDREMTAAPWDVDDNNNNIGAVAVRLLDGTTREAYLYRPVGCVSDKQERLDSYGTAYLRNNAARIASELRRLNIENERLRLGSSHAPPTETERVYRAMDRAGMDVGIYRKFVVERVDGSSGPGGKHERCDYFVLDWAHGKFAPAAALAYAATCESEYPALAADLRTRADRALRGDT